MQPSKLSNTQEFKIGLSGGLFAVAAVVSTVYAVQAFQKCSQSENGCFSSLHADLVPDGVVDFFEYMRDGHSP